MKRLLIGLAALVGLVGAGYTTYADGKASGRAELAWASSSDTDDEPVLIAQADVTDAGAGPGVAAAPLGIEPVHTDTGVAPPVAATAPSAPVDPVDDPSGAFDGFREWLKLYGWGYAILFAFGSVLIAVSLRYDRLRKGRAAIAVGTVLAIVTAALAGKAAGWADAQVVMAGMNIALGGGLWALRASAATIDLSTATPEQIAEALRRSSAAAAKGGG